MDWYIWYSDSVITNEWYNTFKYSETSNSLDGSENDLFRGYQDIKKEMRLFKFKLYELYFDDDFLARSDSDE